MYQGHAIRWQEYDRKQWHRTKTSKTNKNEQFTGADNIGYKAQNKDKQNKQE
jgi:hypothetical protein